MIIAFGIAAFLGDFKAPLGGGGDIAVVPIYGPITLGGCGGSMLAVETCADVGAIKQHLKDADDDPSIKAIVLDVYSGGGNVVASRELMRAVRNTQKPTVAWIGEIGASGAYYAASAADRVVADDNSLTGSIGVIMFIEHYYDLFDWVGINVTTIKAGNSKDTGSPYRPMTPEEEKEMKDMVDKVYDSFTSDVAKNRGLEVDYVKNISQGRIYLGSEAKDLGLVDDLGGFDDAVAIAANMSGISGEPNLRRPERKVTLIDFLSQ
ncbi:MAG: signal peptide peptidase SppA [Candidatus Altiarchaeota archaeon]